MKLTEQTNELDCALLAAQAKFPVVEKSKDNPYYKSKYAPYEEIYRGVKPSLCENGLLLMHDPKVEFSDIEAEVVYKEMEDSSGATQIIACAKVTVTTILRHAKSGQERSVEFVAYPDRSNMHGVQAAVTYLKRNNIILLLDIAVGDEDDDGNNGVTYDPDDKRGQTSQRRAGTGRRPPSNQNGSKPEFTTGSGKPVDMKQATSGLKPEDLEPQPGDLPFDDTPPIDTDGAQATAPAQTIDPARPMTDAERKRLGFIDAKEVDTMMASLKNKGITKDPWLSYLLAEYSYKTMAEIKKGKEYTDIMLVIEKEPQKIMNPGA